MPPTVYSNFTIESKNPLHNKICRSPNPFFFINSVILNFIQTYLNHVTKNEMKCIPAHLPLYLRVIISVLVMYLSSSMPCKTHKDRKLPVRNNNLSVPFRHIGELCPKKSCHNSNHYYPLRDRTPL